MTEISIKREQQQQESESEIRADSAFPKIGSFAEVFYLDKNCLVCRVYCISEDVVSLVSLDDPNRTWTFKEYENVAWLKPVPVSSVQITYEPEREVR